MKHKDMQYDIGVIIGRFQVPELHDAHMQLIDKVIASHKRVIVFLGISPTLGTKNNPLDFTSRVGLFDEYLKKYQSRFYVHSLKDCPGNDEAWSTHLDILIRSMIPLGSVCLYGGRDSFIAHYTGKYDTYELSLVSDDEGKSIRKEHAHILINSVDFRAGQIYQSQNKFPQVYPTVDIALVREEEDRSFTVLMGIKDTRELFSFPGGFVDPTDPSYEDAAIRELFEEVDTEISCVAIYLCSRIIDDPRYTGEEKIMTSFFVIPYAFGSGKPKEEFVTTDWVMIHRENIESVAPQHRYLFERLIMFMGDNTSLGYKQKLKKHSK